MKTTKIFAQLAYMNLGFDTNPHPENGGTALDLMALAVIQAGTVEDGQRGPANTACPGLVPSAPRLEA